jgi:hypothetical protein
LLSKVFTPLYKPNTAASFTLKHSVIIQAQNA